MEKLSLPDIRKDYRMATLDEKDVNSNPFAQFEKWFGEILHSGIAEPNAMTLATATKKGHVSARIVLLKGFDSAGFYFYTNYESKKANQINENPAGALVFFWKELERQVRIEGRITRSDGQNSDAYYQSRPEKSRISAWASPQSQVIPDRAHLEDRVKRTEEQFKDSSLTRPPFWGGYLLQPALFEFWQGRGDRLHDRIQYLSDAGGTWKIQRLAP